MHIILLLILIVVILLGGAGLIFSLLYGLFVLAWAAAPWLLGMVAIMFVVKCLPKFSGGHHSDQRWTEAESRDDPASITRQPWLGEQPEMPPPAHVREAIELDRRLREEHRAKVEQSRNKKV